MKIKKVYLGRKQIYPDGWSPGENTKIYIPMKTDLLDHSGRSITVTNSGFSIVDGTGYKNGGYLSIPNSAYTFGTADFTISFWEKFISAPTYYRSAFSTNNSNYGGLSIKYENRQLVAGHTMGTWDFADLNAYDSNPSVRVLWTTIRNGTTRYVYKNGVLFFSQNANSINIIQNSGEVMRIGLHSSTNTQGYQSYMSDFIIESKARTAQEITDYYNQTKSNYGIS